MAVDPVDMPFPIFEVSKSYLIYDLDVAMHLRRAHNMCGTLVGNIPQFNQQNTFSGLPLELMSEEARLLVEQGHAYIVDDTRSHLESFSALGEDVRRRFREQLREEGLEVSRELERQNQAKKAYGLAREQKRKARQLADAKKSENQMDADESLFGSASSQPLSQISIKTNTDLQPQLIIPTTSYPPLTTSSSIQSSSLPMVPPSYPLFAHLHSKGYFMTPGIRFGCQYTCYPGDPLRFHSHFLALGFDWDDEINLLDIVGGGRLGTGVKKGYLIGGVDPEKDAANAENGDESVRTFCFEWAAM